MNSNFIFQYPYHTLPQFSMHVCAYSIYYLYFVDSIVDSLVLFKRLICTLYHTQCHTYGHTHIHTRTLTHSFELIPRAHINKLSSIVTIIFIFIIIKAYYCHRCIALEYVGCCRHRSLLWMEHKESIYVNLIRDLPEYKRQSEYIFFSSSFGSVCLVLFRQF